MSAPPFFGLHIAMSMTPASPLPWAAGTYMGSPGALRSRTWRFPLARFTCFIAGMDIFSASGSADSRAGIAAPKADTEMNG